MRTYHSIHVSEVTTDQMLEGLDKFFFHRYFTRRASSSDEGRPWVLGLASELGGWVTLYDQGENFRRANLVARALSAQLHRPALWLGLFEDLDFYYQLFSDGESIDAYDSDASIYDPEEGFTEDPEGTGWLPADFSGVNKDRNLAGLGNPTAVMSVLACDKERDAVRLQSLLSRGRAYHGPDSPRFEELSWVDGGVAQLASLLGIPAERASTGFDELTRQGEPPGWLKVLEYHRVARPPGGTHRRSRGEDE